MRATAARKAVFELGPGFFDRVEVWRIGRQVQHRRPARLDALAHAIDLVCAEIVHDDHVTGAQLGAQHMIEVDEKDLSVGGRFDGHGGQHAGVVHRAQHGQSRPVSARHRCVHALPVPAPGIEPRPLCADAALVQVDQVLRRDPPDRLGERFALEPVFFAVALGGVERLFSRSPHRPQHAPQMRRAHRMSSLSHGSDELMQHQVGLHLDQTPDQIHWNPARSPSLRSAHHAAGLPPGCRYLPRPANAHTQTFGQFSQRALARSVGLQQLPSQIIALRPCHPSRTNLFSKPARHQVIYHP